MKFEYLIGLLMAFPIMSFANNTPVKSIESFEEGLPPGFAATGTISLNTQRMKHGDHSVKWEWRGNDQIVFDTPVGYHKSQKLTIESAALQHVDLSAGDVMEPPHGFFMWIYNDEARPQRLRFEFGRGEDVDCWFDYNLNFKGWRTVALNYDRGDMKGLPREDMTRMTIHAPNTGSGTFFIDAIGLSVPMNPRTVNPTPQLPEIDPHARLVSQYEHCMYKFSKQTPTFNLEPLTDETIADFRTLEKQAMPFVLKETDRKQWNDSKIKGVEKKFAQFEIVRDGDKIYGRPLVYGNIIKEYFSETGVPQKELLDGVIDWRYGYCGTLFQIARAWEFTESAENKARLESMFMDLFDYGIDQGMAAGAGLGWIHHYSYIIREFIPALFVMREPLEKSGRLDEAIEVAKWFTSFNQVYREDLVYGYEGRKANDADDMQGLLTLRLITPLLMKDSPEKARDLAHFASYFSNVSTAYANALDDTLKPDGVFFHHGGQQYTYGGRAIYGAVRTYHILRGTKYAPADDVRLRLLKCARTYHDTLFTDKQAMTKTFANCRFGKYEHPSILDGMFEMLGEEYQPLDGFRMLPYTCVGVKRHKDDWMITARSYSKYVYPFESWGRHFFAYSLFVANGYTDVSYPNSLDSMSPENGGWHPGIDWRRWPGSTTVRLPYENVVVRVGQVRDEGGEYLFSDQPFSGGVETSYGCGVQTFQFKGHDKYGLESFTGRKSWFFVGDKVICLGSDIQSGIKDYTVETTLFQSHLTDSSQPIVVNGKNVDAFPFQKQLTGQKNWMIDNRGTGFYVPNGSIHLTRAEQTNPQYQDDGELSGNFATAWIDHGIAPENAEYEYVLMADANPDKMAAFVKKPMYEVVQKDRTAHVVELKDERATAYAVYAEKGTTFAAGPVKAVNKQSTFIVKKEGGKLRLSVSDPDLNIYDGQEDLMPDGTRCELSIYEREWYFWPSRPHTVRITLDGEWTLDDLVIPMETVETQPKVVSSANGRTVIDVVCRDGLSAELLLRK